MSTAIAAPKGAAAAAAQKSGHRGRSTNAMRGGSPMIYFVALVVVALSISPVLYGVISGFRKNGDLILNPSGMPNPWILDNYIGVFKNPQFWTYTSNSVAIALITTLLVVICGVMAAFPLARYHFRGREAIFTVFVAGLLFLYAGWMLVSSRIERRRRRRRQEAEERDREIVRGPGL